MQDTFARAHTRPKGWTKQPPGGGQARDVRASCIQGHSKTYKYQDYKNKFAPRANLEWTLRAYQKVNRRNIFKKCNCDTVSSTALTATELQHPKLAEIVKKKNF